MMICVEAHQRMGNSTRSPVGLYEIPLGGLITVDIPC